MRTVIYSFFVCAFLISGCSGAREMGMEAVEMEPVGQVQVPAQLLPNFEYRLGNFDVLEIRVWEGVVKPTRRKREGISEDEYLISRGDVLNIYVWQWADLNQDVIVRPDGRISFPLVGDVIAEGLTLTELDEIITELLKEYIKYPEVSVMIRDFGQSGFGAKRILAGFPEQVRVRPDGRISFPFIGEIMARGITLRQLDERLTQDLSNFTHSPEVYVNLVKIGGKRVIVLGEVNTPGVIKMQEDVRLLDIIAMAGGYTKDAALGSVILIRGGLANPQARRINLAGIIKRGNLRENVYIHPEDIIYIPKTFISDLNYVLKQVLGPLQSSGEAVTSIKTIRERTTPFLSTGD